MGISSNRISVDMTAFLDWFVHGCVMKLVAKDSNSVGIEGVMTGCRCELKVQV